MEVPSAAAFTNLDVMGETLHLSEAYILEYAHSTTSSRQPIHSIYFGFYPPTGRNLRSRC